MVLPILESERLRLRMLHNTDAKSMFEYAQKDRVTKYLLWDSHTSLRQTKQFLKHIIAKYLDGNLAWAITLKDSGEFIGMIDFSSFDHAAGIAEIAYAISDKYWGKGLITEATQMLIDYGFNVLHLERISARCFAENIGSERVMQKVGMTHEGTLRKAIFKKGAYHDMKIYAIITDDYKASSK
jgi:[ribosomal protein S5]-alanine N-acetyltransferase